MRTPDATSTAVVFRVTGTVPRAMPYKWGRYGPYVPADVKAWRKRIARTFLKHGGRAPRPGEPVYVVVLYRLRKDHVDLDSGYHSIQDALSKDALGVKDKEWQGSFALSGIVPTAREESVLIMVCYEH